MFGTFALTALLASALVARADVVPSAPGPGVVYNAGATCRIEWDGDKDSNTVWKGMSIELMTGSNFEMVHLTTVATNQDGTASGFFEHPCPAVNPFSAIYFYQFTSPLSPNKTWTTRFTIASPTGATTPPANPTQPGTNEPIPWGTGALADPSTAVPAPAYLNGGSPAASAGNSTSAPPASFPPTTLATTPSSTPARTTATTTGTAKPAGTASSAPNASANSNSTSANTNAKDNAALSVDSRTWQVAVVLAAFAALL